MSPWGDSLLSARIDGSSAVATVTRGTSDTDILLGEHRPVSLTAGDKDLALDGGPSSASFSIDLFFDGTELSVLCILSDAESRGLSSSW